jgi:AraC family transcriptional regulator, transcriptional activator of the genes for pyochelin and ferripyochelin receptors
MTKIITSAEYSVLWEAAQQGGELAWQWNEFEGKRSLPRQLGQGTYRQIELRHGLTIWIDTLQYWHPLHLDYEFFGSNVLLSNFYLAGNHRIINPGLKQEADREESANESCLCFIPEARSIEYYPAEQTLQTLQIEIDLDELRSFSGSWDALPPMLQQLSEGKSVEGFHQSFKTATLAMRQGIQQILNCPYHGITKQLYLEGKALELLALQFTQWLEDNPRVAPAPIPQREDKERLYWAKEILQSNLQHPPSLLELARQVGLNDYKLKRGFRQIFGTTVFGYLQNCRLEQAQHLLVERYLSVAALLMP